MTDLQTIRKHLCFALLLLAAISAHGAGPRWVAGAKWTNDSRIMNWYRPDVQYFVDAGPLSASVDHAAATALVDSAAAVWTVDGIPFSLRNGGTLNEDVSGENVYLGTTGLVWPADVQKSNYTSKQIAVIFDADGSITDTLLGSGASAPGNCRTNAVTESVDLFIQPGKIAHALIVLNGRCTGSAPEQQLQLRYQLMRIFGRVIGLGWSQLNDNVFTGTPAPQYLEQLHWPIMHPIDVICGAYTYQCLPQPFTLRDDDIASLAMVNAEQLNQRNSNKVTVDGWIRFPDGQGMNGVNLVGRRSFPNDGYGTEPFGSVSAVSGFLAVGNFGNPVSGPSVNTDDNGGGTGGFAPGYFVFYGVPSLSQFAFTSLDISTEPMNPLYTGRYAVGPYGMGSPAPSGDGWQTVSFGNASGAVSGLGTYIPPNAAYQCGGSADGTEDVLAQLPTEGVWSGRFCGVGHTAWSGFTVRAGRTATLEVTALDEAGTATTAKAMPVIGLWHASDATGTTPSIGKTIAFNSTRVGMTQLRASFTADEQVRLAVADQRGDGRPDYVYRARLLYADTVSPARMVPAGGAIRILGTGFQQGSTVTVGGVAAMVTSLTATEIDAVAPSASALGGTAVNNVTVTDSRTGASASILGGLTYGGAANDTLTVVSAPGSTVYVGAPATFAVRLTDSNGAPAQNATIAVSATAGTVLFDTCGMAACTILTDASGFAQTHVTPQSAGSITLRAVAKSGSSVQSSFVAFAAVQSITLQRPTQYVASPGALFHPTALLTGTDAEHAARGVAWSATPARINFENARSNGAVAQVDATSLLRESEIATVRACSSGVCTTGDIIAVAAANLRVVPVSGDSQSVLAAGALQTVTIRVVDTAGHAVAGAVVAIHQEVTGWQPPCAAPGRCAVAPVYGQANTSATSDDDGLVMFDPLQFSGTAVVTRATVTVGTSGSHTVTLQKTP